MEVRVPRILRDTLERNPDYFPRIRDSVERLATEIEQDAPLPAPGAPAPDVATWTAAHAEHAGESWLHAEWFHAELSVYRELASRCRFWETGRDPFAPAKEEELSGDRPWTRLEAVLALGGTREDRLRERLDGCLWGNRVDLSYTVAAARGRQDDDLIVDERDSLVPLLCARAASVHVVADNAGTELALDLAVVDAVLEDPGAHVALHLKMQPVFVSDALPADVWRLLEGMIGRGGDVAALAGRLRAAFEERRLELWPDPFWSGPRFLREAPPHLERALRSARVVLLKGDANYRRVTDDAIWPPHEPFARAADGLGVPVACVRTMKSDSVLGLPAGLAEQLSASDARWRIDGRRGLIQMYGA